MQKIWHCVAVLTSLFFIPDPTQAQSQTPTRSSALVAIDAAADATALSEFCVNWAIDSVTVRQYLRSRNVRIIGYNRTIFGAAYARTHDAAWRSGNYPAACDKALDLYGPQGRLVAGLVRPVWHGACGDCQLGNAPARAAADAADP
jgi:hypothetical protein